jgi:hypothetical protein
MSRYVPSHSSQADSFRDGRGVSRWPLGVAPVGWEGWCGERRCVSDMSGYVPSQSSQDDSFRDGRGHHDGRWVLRPWDGRVGVVSVIV